jgi:hypothetical protein
MAAAKNDPKRGHNDEKKRIRRTSGGTYEVR